MSTLTDHGIWSLQKARANIDKAHKEACNALACFDADKTDNSLPAEDRIAARSLLDQTATLCKAILCAMDSVPEAAQPKAVRATPPELPCIKTAAWMLKSRKHARPLAASVLF